MVERNGGLPKRLCTTCDSHDLQLTGTEGEREGLSIAVLPLATVAHVGNISGGRIHSLFDWVFLQNLPGMYGK